MTIKKVEQKHEKPKAKISKNYPKPRLLNQLGLLLDCFLS